MQNEKDLSSAARHTKELLWNVIVTVRDGGFGDAKRTLKHYGAVESTNFYNVLIMHVDHIDDFLHDFSLEYSSRPYLQDCFSRVMPLMKNFSFESREEFEHKLKEASAEWLNRLKGKTFHVRIHRRGAKEFISSLMEEKFLDTHILESLEAEGVVAHINFSDPDFIIDVEILGQEGGVSIWTREELHSRPFFNLD